MIDKHGVKPCIGLDINPSVLRIYTPNETSSCCSIFVEGFNRLAIQAGFRQLPVIVMSNRMDLSGIRYKYGDWA